MKIFFLIASLQETANEINHTSLLSMSFGTEKNVAFTRPSCLFFLARLIQKNERGTCWIEPEDRIVSQFDVFLTLFIHCELIDEPSRLTCARLLPMLERKLIFFSHNHPASILCFLFGRPVKASEAQSLRLCEDIISFLKHLRIARMTKRLMCSITGLGCVCQSFELTG